MNQYNFCMLIFFISYLFTFSICSHHTRNIRFDLFTRLTLRNIFEVNNILIFPSCLLTEFPKKTKIMYVEEDGDDFITNIRTYSSIRWWHLIGWRSIFLTRMKIIVYWYGDVQEGQSRREDPELIVTCIYICFDE
jgi:hypothetical protein